LPETPVRLFLEQLETRLAPAAVSWDVSTGGNWDTGSNWSSGVVPGPGDDVTINVPGITVTHSSSIADSVHSLQTASTASLTLSAGSLTISASSTLSGPFTLSGGTLTVSEPLTLGNSTWSGGTITASGGLTIGSGTKIVVPGAASVTFAGSITNNGTIELTPTSSGSATLQFSGNVTLGGAGQLLMDTPVGNNFAYLKPLSSAVLTNAAPHTIGGTGFLGYNGAGTVANQGTLLATSGAYPGLALAGAAYTNTGTISVGNGDLLILNYPANLNNTGGQLQVNGGNFYAFNGTVTSGGSFNFVNSATLTGGGFIDSITVPAGSNVVIPGGNTMIAKGTITNNGMIELHPVDGGRAGLYCSGNVTLSGTGQLFLDPPSPDGHYAFCGPINVNSSLTDAVGQTIVASGLCYYGYRGVGTITNQGTISALGSSATTLNLDAGAYTNSGAIAAASGATVAFVLSGVAVNNAGGTIQGNGSTLSLGTAKISGGALALTGSATLTGSAILSDVSLDAGSGSSGTVDSIQNSSTSTVVTLEAGSSLTVTGTYTQSAGTTQVDGTLTATANPVSISGGELLGGGSINGNVNLAAGATYNEIQSGSGTGQYNTLAISGTVSLGGANLSVSCTGRNTPASGQTFTILHSGGALSGSFAQGASAAAGTTTYAISYHPSGVVLTDTPVTITTSTLANGAAGAAYSQGISATGGTGSITFSRTSGALPTGLALSSSGVLSGMPTAPGSYAFTVTATDAIGGTAALGYSVTVSPGALSQLQVSVVGPSSVTAGQAFLVSVQAADAYGNPITSYGGPAITTSGVSPACAGNIPVSVALGSTGFGLFLAELQTVGAYTITVTSGPVHGSAAPVTVTPGPAVKLGFLTQPANTATGHTLAPVTVQVLDRYGNVVTADDSDSVVMSLASGPGGFTAGSTTAATVQNGVATFSNLALVVPGNYALAPQVPGQLTGPYSTSFTIAPLQVVPGSFVGTPSGFSLQFNAPFLANSVTPVLYGQGFGATAPSPSIIVTTDPADLSNTAAYVEGSLILDAPTNSITFVATNTGLETSTGSPLLPDGSYTVIVRSNSVSGGFQSLSSGGGFLDGLFTGNPGSGDYRASFTVSAAASGDDVLWAPATANGPGQALSAPGMNQANAGYPIYLNDTTAQVTSVQVTLNYNPALLTVSGTSGGDFTLLASSTPGQALLQYSGPPLAAGPQTPLGFLLATVPGGTASKPTPYRAKDLLHFSNPSLNGGSIAVATSDALHLVAYVGDADGNGSYGSNDAVLITRVALQSDSGFAAYPLVDPVIVGDTDGSGFIPADAALQVNEAGVGFPTSNLATPTVPLGVVFQPISNNVDPSVSLELRDQSPEQSNGAIVTAAVNLDDAHPAGSTGLVEAHLALTYNPAQFTVAAADIQLGSLLTVAGGWTLIPTIDAATGQIAIALSSTTPVRETGGGSLVIIDFHPTGAGSNPQLIRLAESVRLPGGVVTTELEDMQGAFILDMMEMR
jgi:hypothetical protein